MNNPKVTFYDLSNNKKVYVMSGGLIPRQGESVILYLDLSGKVTDFDKPTFFEIVDVVWDFDIVPEVMINLRRLPK